MSYHVPLSPLVPVNWVVRARVLIRSECTGVEGGRVHHHWWGLELDLEAIVSAWFSSFHDGCPLALIIVTCIHHIRTPTACPECSWHLAPSSLFHSPQILTRKRAPWGVVSSPPPTGSHSLLRAHCAFYLPSIIVCLFRSLCTTAPLNGKFLVGRGCVCFPSC